jgi:hypothetical protein
VAGLVACGVLLAACGGDDEPELTIEEQLEQIEGRPLTPSEIEEKLAVGQTLCQMTGPVLDKIWFQLDDEQLEFQDLVFGRLCPERSVFYAGQTGRFVTDAATESGVVTSTTRPPPTTSTSSSSSTSSTTSSVSGSTASSSSTTSGSGGSTTAPASTATTADTASTTTTASTVTTANTVTTASTVPPSTSSTRVGEGG